jgi:hypothetical protein
MTEWLAIPVCHWTPGNKPRYKETKRSLCPLRFTKEIESGMDFPPARYQKSGMPFAAFLDEHGISVPRIPGGTPCSTVFRAISSKARLADP